MSFLKNVTVGLTVGTLTQALNAVIAVLVIRKLGPHDRGVYALVITFITVVAYLLDLGISAANETFLGKREHRVGAVNCNSVMYSVFFGLLVGGIGFACRRSLFPRILPGIPLPFILLVLAILPIALYGVHGESILVGIEEIVLLNKIFLMQAILLAGGSVLFVLVFNGGVLALLVIWVFASITTNVSMFVVILKRDKLLFEPALLRKSLAFGLRAFVARGLRLGSYRLDAFFVNGFMGTTAAGYYSVATALSEKIGPTVRAFVQAANRQVTEAEREHSYHLTSRLLRVLLLFMVVAISAEIVAARLIVRVLFGMAFLPAVTPLRILLVGVVFFCSALALVLFFQNQMRRPEFASGVIAIALAMGAPFYLWAIPRWGLSGAAWVTSLSFGIMWLTFFVIFLRMSRLKASDALLIQPGDVERIFVRSRFKALGGILPSGLKQWFAP